MIFEGQEVECFEYEGKILFNPRHVGKCLELTDITVRDHIRHMNENQVIKLKNSSVGLTNFRKLHNTGENFLTESGVYKLIFKSRKPSAEKFSDWVTDEVLPTLREKGSYSLKPQENQSCTPTIKLYKGVPVAIIQDISRITGFSKGAIRHVINKNCSVFDYKVLKGTELLHFKSENHLQKRLHSLIIIFESGVKKLAKIYRFQPTDLFDSPKLPTVPVREYPPQKLSFMDELKMKSFIMNDLGMSKSIKLNYYYDTFRKFGIDIQFLKNIGAEVRIQQSALELGETIVKDLTKEEALELIEDLKNNPEFTATSQLAQDYTIEFINKAIMLKEVV